MHRHWLYQSRKRIKTQHTWKKFTGSVNNSIMDCYIIYRTNRLLLICIKIRAQIWFIYSSKLVCERSPPTASFIGIYITWEKYVKTITMVSQNKLGIEKLKFTIQLLFCAHLNQPKILVIFWGKWLRTSQTEKYFILRVYRCIFINILGRAFFFDDQENTHLKEENDIIHKKKDFTHNYTIVSYGRLHGHIHPTFVETFQSMKCSTCYLLHI